MDMETKKPHLDMSSQCSYGYGNKEASPRHASSQVFHVVTNESYGYFKTIVLVHVVDIGSHLSNTAGLDPTCGMLNPFG